MTVDVMLFYSAFEKMSEHRCFVFLLLSNIFVSFVSCEVKFYDHTLYGVTPQDDTQLMFLRNLSSKYKVDFWRPPGKVHNQVEFMVPRVKGEEILKAAENINLEIVSLLDDVQRALDDQKVVRWDSRRMDTFNWNSYFQLDDIYEWMRGLERAYPNQVQVKSIGKTLEHRDILVAKVSLRNDPNQPKVMVEGGIHAREWIAPAFVTYLLDQVVNLNINSNLFNANKTFHDELIELALNYEWHFIPVANPDGYAYTHSTNRLWRKNRNGNGVDLNRNFGIAFQSLGALDGRNDPKDETYTGTKPFSEMETIALGNYMLANSKNLLFYLSFHSYGQYMIIPYAYKEEHADNYDDVKIIADKAAQTIKKLGSGTQYRVGTAMETVGKGFLNVGYKTSGVSSCWIKKTKRVPYVLTFELPDEGRYGFALPNSEILRTCQETKRGVLEFIKGPCKYLNQHCQKSERTRTGTKYSGSVTPELNGVFFVMLLFISVLRSILMF